MNYVYFFAELKPLQKTPEQLAMKTRIRLLEKSIWDTRNLINNGEYKLQNYSTLEKIQKQYELVNPLHREWLASV